MMFNCTPPQLAARLKKANENWKDSYLRKDFGALKRVGVTATHLKPHMQYTIDGISNQDATQYKFPDPDDRRPGVEDSQRKQITLAQYFKKKYNMTLILGIPVVRMTKKIRGTHIHLPMDVLVIDENQRYNSKLSDVQTSKMIKFAVTLPKDRWAAVKEGVRLLKWNTDPWLKHYGLQISPK